MSDKLNTPFIKISNPAWGPVGARMCVGSGWRLASGKKMPKHERLNLKIKGLSFKSEKEKLNVRMCACFYPSQLLHPWEKDKGLTSDTRKSKQSCIYTHTHTFTAVLFRSSAVIASGNSIIYRFPPRGIATAIQRGKEMRERETFDWHAMDKVNYL